MLSIQTPKMTDAELFEAELGMKNSLIYINKTNYFQAYLIAASIFNSCSEQISDLITVYSSGKYRGISRAIFLDTIIGSCGVSSDMFIPRGQSKESAKSQILEDVKSTLEKVANRMSYGWDCGYKLLIAYQEWTKLKHLTESMRSKMGMFDADDEVDNYGEKLSHIYFSYIRRSTGRYYTNDDNIQGWHKITCSSIVAPKDYILVWADFNQADLRIAYNLFLKDNGPNDIIFNETKDKYEAFVKIMCRTVGREFNHDEFMVDRDAFKTAILARLYETGMGTLMRLFHNKELCYALDNYYKCNKGYLKFRAQLEEVYNFGIELPVHDYFGYERVIPMPANAYNKFNKASAMRQALNVPPQSTTNSVKMEWCNSIIQTFRDKGYSHELIRPYVDRHDEMVLVVHKSCMKDLWIIEDNMQIAIDDWSLMELKLGIGYKYTVVDEDLMEQYQKVIRLNEDKIRPRTVFAKRKIPYYAVGEIIDAYAITPLSTSAFLRTCQPESTCTAEDECLKALQEIADGGNEWENTRVKQYLKYKDKVLIYLDERYCVLDGINKLPLVAKKFQTKFVQLFNGTSDMFIDTNGTYIKARNIGFPAVCEKLDRALEDLTDYDKWIKSGQPAKGSNS